MPSPKLLYDESGLFDGYVKEIQQLLVKSMVEKKPNKLE